MKRTIILILLSCLLLTGHSRTIRDFFAAEPDDIFILVPHTARLDMLDYYDSGMSMEMSNKLGDGSKLEYADSSYLKIRTSESRVVEMLMLQYSKHDTILAVIETVTTPVPDSRLRFFNSNWVELSSIKPLKQMPSLTDFFLPATQGKKRNELLEQLPFTMLEMTFDGDDHSTMLVKHNLDKFLSTEQYAHFKPHMAATIKYAIKGAKFTRIK